MGEDLEIFPSSDIPDADIAAIRSTNDGSVTVQKRYGNWIHAGGSTPAAKCLVVAVRRLEIYQVQTSTQVVQQ